ncbi:MAG TPA: 4-(cytidine 5'-diphospho)-2-C-methyl-D-erythritol kinase [Gemmatimonadales bacterium]|jgi:4-diphosphocytidyl-2-C-methyl-D-erythritol kinase
MTDSIVRDCPAKVNLFLRVLAREEDGYHGIETCFCRVGLADTLAVERTGSGIALTVEGADVGPGEENLAWRAADAVLQVTGRRFGVTMHLTKRIPVAAGLGGGSSDAAGALLAVNQLANNAVPRSELLHAAYRLGADVPFFLLETGCALAWGHGQRMLRLESLPSLPILILDTGVSISTADAYRRVDESRRSAGQRGSVALDLEVLHRWSDIARLAGNEFESVAFADHPRIRAGFEALAATHPILCRMTGSGSALFAVYRTERDRDDAAERLGGKHGRLISTVSS